jgi:hypothetical protein
VRLNGRPIAVINRLADDRQIFSFEQDYIDDPQRPTLNRRTCFPSDCGLSIGKQILAVAATLK